MSGKPLPGKRFSRNVEDFTCGHCGREVRGDGYTNHCPACLWSMHVDIQPGDRLAGCGGLMEPVAVEVRSGEYVIVHHCETCGLERRNRTAAADAFEEILRIAGRGAGR